MSAVRNGMWLICRYCWRCHEATVERKRLGIAIAEACIPNFIEAVEVDGTLRAHCGEFSGMAIKTVVPDYLNDLNAMQSAEELLVCGQIGDYEAWINNLLQVVSVPHASLGTGQLYKLIHASASQRAEAFIKTIGKWTNA